MPIAGALWANSGLMHCNKKERPLCGNDEASQNLVSQPSDAIIDILIMGCRTLTLCRPSSGNGTALVSPVCTDGSIDGSIQFQSARINLVLLSPLWTQCSAAQDGTLSHSKAAIPADTNDCTLIRLSRNFCFNSMPAFQVPT